jgi:DNA-binding IclR family transcriptional regulator
VAEENGIQVVARVASILRALGGADEGLSLSQLAERVELPRSTVHRLVVALRGEGLVMSLPSGRTRIGPELMRLAHSSRGELTRELRPFMERLRAELEETVDLAVLEGDHVRFVDQIAAPHRLRAVSAVGETFPLYCSANGLALLAELPAEARPALIGTELAALTPQTLTDPEAVLAAVEEVERRGYAVTRDQITEGICAVAVAVRDTGGGLAALAVPLPTPRFAGREEEIAAALLAVREEANAALGLA